MAEYICEINYEKDTCVVYKEPLVRCEDCIFWDRDHISCEGFARCITGESGIRYRKKYDFCSRGERKGVEK